MATEYKQSRKQVTTGNTVISNCEKRNIQRSSDLAEAKIYLLANLVIFDMPYTSHLFWSFCSQVSMTMVLGGDFSAVSFQMLRAIVSKIWHSFRRLRDLKSGLVISNQPKKTLRKVSVRN